MKRTIVAVTVMLALAPPALAKTMAWEGRLFSLQQGYDLWIQ